MKLLVDDVRPAPDGYVWCRSVNETKVLIEEFEKFFGSYFLYYPTTGEDYRVRIELLDIDHDAGIYADEGGDYIKLLDWLEETGRNYPIRIHSMNVVGVQNMRRIIQRNGWKEIY